MSIFLKFSRKLLEFIFICIELLIVYSFWTELAILISVRTTFQCWSCWKNHISLLLIFWIVYLHITVVKKLTFVWTSRQWLQIWFEFRMFVSKFFIILWVWSNKMTFTWIKNWYYFHFVFKMIIFTVNFLYDCFKLELSLMFKFFLYFKVEVYFSYYFVQLCDYLWRDILHFVQNNIF